MNMNTRFVLSRRLSQALRRWPFTKPGWPLSPDRNFELTTGAIFIGRIQSKDRPILWVEACAERRMPHSRTALGDGQCWAWLPAPKSHAAVCKRSDPRVWTRLSIQLQVRPDCFLVVSSIRWLTVPVLSSFMAVTEPKATDGKMDSYLR
jgi:hypothetical protein